MKILISFFLMCCISAPAFALQTIEVGVNQKASAQIANDEFNRLFVENDRITSVKGKQGQYQLQSDELLGEVYLFVEDKVAPIVIFVSTEKKKTIQLRLVPQPLEAQTIEIKVIEPKELVLASKENINIKDAPILTAPFIDYTYIIQRLEKGEPIDGAKSIAIKPTKLKPIEGGLQAKIIKLVRGTFWQAEVYELYNPSFRPIDIKAAQFKTPGVQAISPSGATLLPHKTMRLIKVVQHG